MDTKLLKQIAKTSSQATIAKELGVSKATVNRLLKGTYPNPSKHLKRVLEVYGNGSEILGVAAKSCTMQDLSKLVEEL